MTSVTQVGLRTLSSDIQQTHRLVLHNHTTTAKTQRNTAKTRRNTKGPFKLNISQNFGNFLKSVQLLSRSLCSSSWIAFPQLATSSKDFSSSRAKEEFFAKEDFFCQGGWSGEQSANLPNHSFLLGLAAASRLQQCNNKHNNNINTNINKNNDNVVIIDYKGLSDICGQTSGTKSQGWIVCLAGIFGLFVLRSLVFRWDSPLQIFIPCRPCSWSDSIGCGLQIWSRLQPSVEFWRNSCEAQNKGFWARIVGVEVGSCGTE